MGLLDHLDAAAGGACERAYGEAAELRPQRLGRISESTDDPSRPAQTVRGIFAIEAGLSGLFDDRRGGSGARGNAPVVQAEAMLELSAATVAGLPYDVRKGDVVVMPRRGNARYRVGHILVADIGSQTLFLSRVEATT